MAKANKQRKDEISVCENCGIEYHKLYSSKGNYCSSKCCYEGKSLKKYNDFLSGDSSMQRGNYSPRFVKPFILKEQNNKCAICNIEPIWNKKSLVFILDHIDGNASNNTRENLRCICPNCDSQLDTYKSKNKNGARSYYRYHKNI